MVTPTKDDILKRQPIRLPMEVIRTKSALEAENKELQRELKELRGTLKLYKELKVAVDNEAYERGQREATERILSGYAQARRDGERDAMRAMVAKVEEVAPRPLPAWWSVALAKILLDGEPDFVPHPQEEAGKGW